MLIARPVAARRAQRAQRAQRGVTLIELMIGLAIVGILMMTAIPSFSTFLRNAKIRNAAETTISGINLARAEAVRRNATVRFQLVSSLTSACALSSSSLDWVVSISDPTGACGSTPGGSAAPQIIQAKSGTEGSDGVSVAATGGTTLVFNGLGRLNTTGITQLLFTSPSFGTCTHQSSSGTLRCLQINVSTSGAAKLCDPKVTDTTDPRYCS